jgi:hypothetical protein
MKIRYVTLILLFCTSLFTGCLTAEYKDIRLKLNADGKSGSGIMLFTGISSSPGDTLDVSHEDFNSLINEYYLGNKIETENKGMKNVKKRLFMQNGTLYGEVSFEFDKLEDLGIYRHNDAGPYMYYTVADGFFTSGQYEESNGSYGGEKLPLVFWEPNTRDFHIKMALSTPQEIRKPLAHLFESWQTQRK